MELLNYDLLDPLGPATSSSVNLLPAVVNISVAEIGRGTIGFHKTVESVDTLQVVHGTECKVSRDPICSIHKLDRSRVEGPDLIHRALSSTVEVLREIVECEYAPYALI